MQPIPILAGILVLLTATLSLAAVTDPFPDQPGALTDEELKAVASAAGTALPLIASGKRRPGHSMPAYALFAGEAADFAGRAKVRTVLVCNLLGPGPGVWQCGGLQKMFQMSANGMEHLFYYRTEQGEGDPQAALAAVDFMYSKCYWDAFAAIGGKPFTPSPEEDYVSTVMVLDQGLQVATGALGDGDNYTLEKSGDGCGLRILRARIAKTNTLLPASFASEMALNRTWRRVQQEAKNTWIASMAGLAIPAMWAAMASGLLALIAPWFFLFRGPGMAALVSGVLATVCTVFAVISDFTMLGDYHMRIDLLLVVTAWLTFAVLAFLAGISVLLASLKPPNQGEVEPREHERHDGRP